jgi:LemA protein
MSARIVIRIVAAAVVLAVGGILSTGYNRLVDLEERLEAQHDQTRNVYASISNEIRSQGLVVDQYRESVLQAIEAAMTGRYGKTGAEAAVLLIREQNPQMSQQVFLKLQNVISASYAKFERAQAVKLDIVREYEASLRRFPSNMVAGLFGFPQTDLEKIKQIVVNAAADEAFQTRRAEPLNPFGSSDKK